MRIQYATKMEALWQESMDLEWVFYARNQYSKKGNQDKKNKMTNTPRPTLSNGSGIWFKYL